MMTKGELDGKLGKLATKYHDHPQELKKLLLEMAQRTIMFQDLWKRERLLVYVLVGIVAFMLLGK